MKVNGFSQGKRTVEILGRPFVLQITTNAMARAEIEAGLSFDEIISWCARGSIAGTRGLIYMLVVEHQPTLTIKACGDLIDEAGGVSAILEILGGQLDTLLKATVPDPKDVQALGLAATRPQKAQDDRPAGTGTRSSSRRGKSA